MKNQFENPKGLHQRYVIKKLVQVDTHDLGKQISQVDVDEDSEYFILRLDDKASDPKHLQACRIAINAYADAIEHHIPKLGADLKERYPIIHTKNPEFLPFEPMTKQQKIEFNAMDSKSITILLNGGYIHIT